MSTPLRIVLEPIVFDTKSEVIAGSFREIVRPEAVDRTLRERIDVRALVDHDPSKITGRVTAGTLELTKGADELRAVITPPDTSYVRDVVQSIRRLDIDGGSFSFLTVADRWFTEDAELMREVLDMRVYEVSIVTFPAYPATDVQVVTAPGHSVASARLKQYAAEHALDHWNGSSNYESREVIGMDETQRELAMLRFPDGRPVERQVAEQAVREFREACREKFGVMIPVSTGDWVWNRSRGWYRRDEDRQETPPQRPGTARPGAALRLRIRRHRQMMAEAGLK